MSHNTTSWKSHTSTWRWTAGKEGALTEWKGVSQTSAVDTGDASCSFASAMAQALRQLDHDGCLTAENALLLRRAIATTPRAHRLGVAVEPERYLGAFGALPQAARDAIVQAIEDSDQWGMAGYGLGDWYFAISRLLRASRVRLSKGRFGPSANRLIAWLMGPVQIGPAIGLQAAYLQRLLWQGKFAARPTLAAMLALAQLEPWPFAVCYAQGVPQQAAFRGFWHDPAQQNTVGVMLGLDLLPSTDGWWFLESNLNSALREQRSALYHWDPFVANLLEFVRAKGYQHLIVMTQFAAHADKQMAKQFEEGAAEHKIRLTIIENAHLQKTTYRQSYGVPPLNEGGTLVVRFKRYPTSLDSLFYHKLASRRALELYKRCSAEPTLLLPPTGLQPILSNIEPNDPFPNLVYKDPTGAQGKQVVFLKAMSMEHARALVRDQRLRPPDRPRARLMKRMLQRPESPDGLFEPYIRSSMLPGRHLYIVRAHVLLTPIGTHFLSAHRVISGSPVPEHLPPGVVQNPVPYLVNYSQGARYEIVPPEEEPAVVAAALAVAEGLSWAAAYSFRTRP